MLLLKKNIIKKKQIDKNDIIKLDIDNNNSRKYKVKAIYNSAVYIKKLAGHLLGLYYLVS